MDSEPTRDEQVHLHYRKLAEHLPNSVVYIIDHELRVVFAGGSLTARSRWPATALSGKDLRDIMPPATFAMAEPHLRATIDGQERSYELVYPTGEAFDVRTAPLPARDGTIREILVVALEVTARKHAEAALAESERFARATLDGLSAHIAIVDVNGTILAVNRAWRDFAFANFPLTANVCEGANYLAVCGAAAAAGCKEAEQWMEGMRAVVAGEVALATLVYPCHTPDEQRWFVCRITRFAGEGPVRLVVAHENITERKLAEIALSDSETRYRTLFEENHSVMLLIHHETGDIFDANPAAAAYYGWTREQLRTMSIFDINAASPAEVEAEIQRAEAEQRNYGWFRHRLADGSLRDVEVYTSTVELNGQVMRHAIAYDVTKRKQAEDALVRSEAALKRSQAVAHVGHWTWDTRSNTVTLSDELRHIVGLDSAMYAGDLDETMGRVIHPDDVERLRAMVSGVLAEQQVVEIECRVVWPDGSIHYVLGVPGDRTVDEQGNIVQLSGVVQDVTERKLREVEREQLLLLLQDKAEQLSQVVRSVPEGVLLLDNMGCVLLTNPRAEAMLALLGTMSEDRRLTHLASEELETFFTSPPLGQWHTVRAGHKVYEVIARPVESGPVPGGWVLVLRDVTTELAVQEQLQRQERLAAVGQLAAGIAHDFNNIMSVITIYAELTGEAPGLTEIDRSRMATIYNQAMRATLMIRQILDFSRQSVLERQVLDLLPLLKEQVKLLKQTLPESIEVEFAHRRGEYFVLADPTRMQQLVINLAVNARDAMPQGGQLRIALDRFTPTAAEQAAALPAVVPGGVPGWGSGEWVRLEIQDTGVGIRPETMTHIFEPFFTTKEPGKGTGLGLAQAHGIVAQHEGHISVASEVGKGTTFSVFLPLQVLAAEPTTSRAARPALPRGQGERVLVVEDDAVLRASLVELLGEWNYQVVQAPNGNEALAFLVGVGGQAGATVDLILSDVVMPLLGGVGLIKALRRHGVKTPAILMSGHPMGEERAGLQEIGVEAWLDKPPSSWELAQAVARALGNG